MQGVLDPADRRPEVEAHLRAWLQFQATLGLRLSDAHSSLDANPEPAAALRASGVPSKWSAARLEQAAKTLRRMGAVGLPISARAYPDRLRPLSDAPPLVWVLGSISDLAEVGVAIVGSRAATAYGLDVARRLAGELARAGAVVISGLARGIDAAAHQGALDAGGRTVAVQACGPDLVYPAAHTALARRVRESGAIVTELPPGMRPRPAFFPLRNRMISALAQLVVVVEARPRSGSLITARHALDQGGEVMAVPGPITAPTSGGTNGLLRDGASPVTELRDVLDAIGLEPEAAVQERRVLSPSAEHILAALRERPRSRDELDRQLALPGGELHLELLELQLAGLVAENRDGCWVALD